MPCGPRKRRAGLARRKGGGRSRGSVSHREAAPPTGEGGPLPGPGPGWRSAGHRAGLPRPFAQVGGGREAWALQVWLPRWAQVQPARAVGGAAAWSRMPCLCAGLALSMPTPPAASAAMVTRSVPSIPMIPGLAEPSSPTSGQEEPLPPVGKAHGCPVVRGQLLALPRACSLTAGCRGGCCLQGGALSLGLMSESEWQGVLTADPVGAPGPSL